MSDTAQTSRLRFWQRYRGLPPTVFALSVVSFLNDTSSEIIYPLLPAFLFLTLGATPFAIGLIEAFWSGYFSVEYKDVAAFSLLILVLIFRPTGLLGKPEIEKV